MKNILASEFILNILRSLLLVAASIKLLQLTNSIAFFGLAILLEAVSSVIAPMYVGRIIDRKGAFYVYEKTLWLTLIFSSLVWLVGSLFDITAVYIFIAYSVISFFTPLQRIAQQSYFAELKHQYDLKTINANHQICVQVGQVLGLLMAIFLVDTQSFYLIYTLANVLLCLVFAILFYAPSLSISETGHQMPKELAIKSLLNTLPSALLIVMVISTFDYLLISVFNLSLSVIASVYQKQHGAIMAYFDIAYAVGAIFISYLITKNVYFKRHLLNNFLVYLLLPLLFVGLIYSHGFGLRMLLIFLIGVCISLSSVSFNAYLQSELPKEMIGRVLALRRIVLSVLLFVVINPLSAVHRFGDQAYYLSLILTVVFLSVILLFFLRKVLSKHVSVLK